jgi:hypothetical protein
MEIPAQTDSKRGFPVGEEPPKAQLAGRHGTAVEFNSNNFPSIEL